MSIIDQLATALAGRYNIEREIGAGGMATVYLARDVRHGRSVALKVLKPELGAVLGAERFLTEIQVTAQLQHPNLLPLFDSGEAAGLLFYVMPFVEGETLRALLDREKQLPVDEALRITAALAGALQYAHDRGVIHRDLKPENILLQAGQPVIADFGIALAVSNAGGARVTQTGLSLGTPQYMSPEQATGDRGIDARTDVYSLAAMTYEMLTGEPPHVGNTAQAIIAKLMTEDPRPVSVLRRAVPPHVEAALSRALEKLPADRLPSAAAFAAALSGERPVAPTAAMRTTAGATKGVRWREGVAWIAAASALGFALWPRDRTPPVAAVAGRFEIDLPDSLNIVSPAGGSLLDIARDGSVLVVVARARRAGSGRAGLWMRSADDPAFRPVPGTSGASSPRVSPDGAWVLFSDDQGALRKVPLSGGEPVTILPALPGGVGVASYGTASWGENDQILVSAGEGSIALTDAGGGAVRTIIAPDSADGRWRRFSQPEWLPGGTHALVMILHATQVVLDSTTIGVVDVAAGTVRPLPLRGFFPRYLRSGHLVYGQGNALMAVPFSLAKRSPIGAPTRLVEPVTGGNVGLPRVAVADNGWLVAHLSPSTAPTRRLVQVDRAGRERSLTDDSRALRDPRVSADGRRVVLSISTGAFNTGDLWVLDLPTGGFSRLTSDGRSYRPKWSRDGRFVYFVRTIAGSGTSILRRPWDGSGTEEVLLSRPLLAEIEPGLAGGLSVIRTLGLRDLLLAPTESLSATTPFVTGPRNETNPALSPDGRWLAYQSDETDQNEVYLRPVPGPGARLSVSTRGGVHPRWSRDGRRLYYRSPEAVMEAQLEFREGTAVVTRRESLFADTYGAGDDGETFDVLPDGSGFVLLRGPAAARAPLTVIPNWLALLRRDSGTP